MDWILLLLIGFLLYQVVGLWKTVEKLQRDLVRIYSLIRLNPPAEKPAVDIPLGGRSNVQERGTVPSRAGDL